VFFFQRCDNACTTFDWHPEGLRFTMSIPIGEKTKQPESVSRGRWTTEEDKGAALRKVMAGNRLLLVEDEALTGMMMRDMLTELGFDVIGPFGRVADAMAAVTCEDILRRFSTSTLIEKWFTPSPMR
jgi:hypothetical protein